MSKRRGREEAEESKPEELTAEDRRAKHRRDRARRKAGRESASRSPWRRVLVIGAPVGVISVVVAFLVVSNLPTPCIGLVPVPTSSGVPAYPPAGTTSFSSTWCPGATEVYGTAPVLTININGTVVNLPASIGKNNSFPGNYECDLPVLTEPATFGFPQNTINILSDWNYAYNLSTFFDVWSESFSHVYVSATSPSQPIIYQSNDILGFTTNGTDAVRLWVDGQLSSKGPLLEISTLDNQITPYPSCLGKVYGTGHTIAITYSKTATPAVVRYSVGPYDATSPANPYAAGLLFDGPLPHFGFLTPLIQEISKVNFFSLQWLALRGLAA
ncbi:MAG: hypothetical protein L3J95_00840 [Thermoplasmata archaeon]|nr:hypothetical protein [Thermoplasmata archaeon]MCI4358964.1 hypothetical protein [Thermoplasmata archaeon]